MFSPPKNYIFLIFKFLGIFPVANIGENHVKKPRISPIFIIYSVCLLVIETCVCLHLLFIDLNVMNRETFAVKTTKITRFATIMFILSSYVAVILVSLKDCGKVIQLHCDIQRIDNLLRVSHVKLHVTSWIALVTYLSACVVLDIVCNSYNGTVTSFSIAMYFTEIVSLGILLQYLMLVESIRSRFQLLNQRISALVMRYRNRKQLDPTTRQPVNDGTELVYARSNPYLNINTLSDIHGALCETIQRTNQVFSWQLLPLTAALFVILVSSAYTSFDYIKLIDVGYSARCFPSELTWKVLVLSKLLLLIRSCSSTTYEARQSASIVCQLLKIKMYSYTRKQVDTFLLQLLHQKIEFSVFGLFPLEFETLMSIIAAVTTYVVILVQFRQADEN